MMKVMAPSTRLRAVKGTTIQDLRPSARNMASCSGFLAVLVTSASVAWDTTEDLRERSTAGTPLGEDGLKPCRARASRTISSLAGTMWI